MKYYFLLTGLGKKFPPRWEKIASRHGQVSDREKYSEACDF